MTYYDPSSRVPLIVTGPGVQAGKIYDNLTQHLDFYPTFMEIANVRSPWLSCDRAYSPLLQITAPAAAQLEGRSLMPILRTGVDPGRANTAFSQFHGDNIHLSWFMLRKLHVGVVQWTMLACLLVCLPRIDSACLLARLPRIDSAC